jgi:hypothetical protein
MPIIPFHKGKPNIHARHIGLTKSKNEIFTYWPHDIFFWEFCDVKTTGTIFQNISKTC